MFNIINGLVTGFAIVIAKNFGAGDHDEMRRSIAPHDHIFGGGDCAHNRGYLEFLLTRFFMRWTPRRVFSAKPGPIS